MPEFKSYCWSCASLPPGDPNRLYHDNAYGFPIASDEGLFCLLVLEINQAGLSWSTILKKKDAFVSAYSGFDIDAVAAYGAADIERLLSDSGIVRNRLKIAAAIENARRLTAIRAKGISFKAWLDGHHPMSKDEWLGLFKQTFVFVGGEIVGEFLMSSGYLSGAHAPDCPAGKRAIKAGAPWAKVAGKPASPA